MQCPKCSSANIYRNSPDKCVCRDCLDIFECPTVDQGQTKDKINLQKKKKRKFLSFRYKLYISFFVVFFFAVVFTNLYEKFFSNKEIYIEYKILYKTVTEPPYSHTTYYLLVPEKYKDRIDYLFREGRLCNESLRSRYFCDAIIWLDSATNKPPVLSSLDNSEKESIYAIYDGTSDSFYCQDGSGSLSEPCTLEKVNKYLKD